jgi:hypothetical protein
MLLIQKYLRSGKSLEDLVKDHGVYATNTNGKISFNYDQIEASNSDPLACECRGLILEEGSWDIIAFPFRRFFNMEQEGVAAKIDWASAKFPSKIDGTCCIVYEFQGVWYVATRSRPEADIALQDDPNFTFRKLADHACHSMWNKAHNVSESDLKGIKDLMEAFAFNRPEALDKTFIFELTSPYNRIVCKYEDVRLTLLGVRDRKTLLEEDPALWVEAGKEYGLTLPEEFHFSSIEDMVKVIREWNPEQREGVVVVDKFWNRVKVKNPAYLSFNHMRESLSTSLKGCAEVILLGKEDDIVGMMPALIANRILGLKPLIQKVLLTTQSDWEELKGIEDMKEFALEAQKKLWPAALFALKRGKTKDLREFSLGNRNDVSKIPASASEMMLTLCRKIDPNTFSSLMIK